LGPTTGHCSSLTLGEGGGRGGRRKQREREREREDREGNEPDKGPATDPFHSAEPRECAAGCQHLSLVKGSLPDNVTLITESPDSEFLSFSV